VAGRPGAASEVPVLLADPQQPPASALGSFGQPGLTLSTPEPSSRLRPLIPLSPSAPGRQAARLSLPRQEKQKESKKLARPRAAVPCRAVPGTGQASGHRGQSIPFRPRFAPSIVTQAPAGPSATRGCPGRAEADPEGLVALRGSGCKGPGPAGRPAALRGKMGFFPRVAPAQPHLARSPLPRSAERCVGRPGKVLFLGEGLCSPSTRAKQLRHTRLVGSRGGGKGERVLLSYRVSVAPYFIICSPIQRENEVPVP